MKHYPQDWKDHYFVFFKNESNGTITSVAAPKAIVLAKTTEGQSLKFYGVRASKFGMRIPQDATKWGIFTKINNEWSLCLGKDLPDPSSKIFITLPDKRIIYLRRGVKNLTFSITIEDIYYKGKFIQPTKKAGKSD